MFSQTEQVPTNAAMDSLSSTHASDGSKKLSDNETRDIYLSPAPKPSLWTTLGTINCGWTPRRCRGDPDRDFELTTTLMLVFSFASAVAAGNLYYIYPILNKAAEDFGVSYEKASLIAQLMQAGYGVGILVFCPLGDVFRLRPIMLTLTITATGTWLGLCITDSFPVFTVLSFLTGFLTVGPQLLLPLVGKIARPDRKGTAVSVVLAGMLVGLAVPRVVTGIVTQYTSWRNIYWAALGLQCVLVCLLWLLFPDYPQPYEPEEENKKGYYLRKYVQVLGEVGKMVVTEPVLAYGCLVTFLANAVFASFWSVLTAHLAAQPFGFGPLHIGLFSLIALGTTTLIPIYTHYVTERYATYLAATFPLVLAVLCICLDSFLGKQLAVVGPVIQAIGVDFGLNVPSVAYRVAMYRVLPPNRATVPFTCCAFVSQFVGINVGNNMYARGGWTWTGIFHIALTGAILLLVFMRGPAEMGWVGWRGGKAVKLDMMVSGDQRRKEAREGEMQRKRVDRSQEKAGEV